MRTSLWSSLKATILLYNWILNNNKTCFLELPPGSATKFKLDVINERMRAYEQERKITLYTTDLAVYDFYYYMYVYNAIVLYDPHSVNFVQQISHIHDPYTPLVIMTQEIDGLRREDVLKAVLSLNYDKFNLLAVMDEKDSAVCRLLMQRHAYAMANLMLSRCPSIIALVIVYVCLFLLLITTLAIMYIFVAILAEKDPVCLPGELDRCLLMKYSLLPNKEVCDRCMICLEEFSMYDICRVLGCQHFFHTACVDPWLQDKSSRCPLCSQHVNVELRS
jgi:hypothetical protein